MADHFSLQERSTLTVNRIHARLAGFGAKAVAFTSSPEPRTIGSVSRGRQLLAGNFLFAGNLIEAPDTSIWNIEMPTGRFAMEVHGCVWLDDLAALGTPDARAKAQEWVMDWITLYGAGKGKGWSPDLTGRRIIRWINHALVILRGAEPETSHKFYAALARQTIFLSRRWRVAGAGLPRTEALAGLVYAGLALEGMEDLVGPAVDALARHCDSHVDASGGIASRNPEELLEVFNLLAWVKVALVDADLPVPRGLMDALERIAPTLRALRHADGELARFHGGGRGVEGRLDRALANARIKATSRTGLAMGYARLSAGRTSVVVDAEAPDTGLTGFAAHASTMAIELTSGRRPLVVNCGSGRDFGRDWRRAGRATPSHSTLGISGLSSAQLGPGTWRGGIYREYLVNAPDDVRAQIIRTTEGMQFEGGHNGYVPSYGLTHARMLDLSYDGRALVGEDLLATISHKDRRQFNAALDDTALTGVPFDLRFHLHPDVEPTLDMGGAAVSMTLKSGEVWVFRHDGVGELALQPSVYLEKGRIRPRTTKQIVLSARAMDYATRIRWSFAKAQDSEGAIRDLAPATAETD
ncbi:heparinase II/III family protein [Donghicola sp. XS_ASV15]|uniref:heparinase II/III family protein n=1 Tax=Donghicola sp. XS_ASV15 TaxID=3241295 RepID=UPI0035126631